MTATAKQISAIHVMAKRAGLDEEARRAVIERETGKRSSRDLTTTEAGRVIEALKVLSGGAETPFERPSKGSARGSLALSGPYVGVCRALWIAAWNLGIVADRGDTALVAFVRRQTHIDSLNWVHDAKHGKALVEALKAWIARDAGVVWPPDREGARGRKRAIVAAQMATVDPTVNAAAVATALDILSDKALDARAMELGRQVRELRRNRA